MRWLMPGAWPSSTCCSLASSANRVEAFSYFAVWWSSRLRNGPGRCEVFGAAGRGGGRRVGGLCCRGLRIPLPAIHAPLRFLVDRPGHAAIHAGPLAQQRLVQLGIVRQLGHGFFVFRRTAVEQAAQWARQVRGFPGPGQGGRLCRRLRRGFCVRCRGTRRGGGGTGEKPGKREGAHWESPGWAAVRSIHSMASAYLGSLDFASACTSAATKRRIQKRRRSARSRELTEFETIQFPLSARLGGALHLHGERHAPGFALRDVLDDRQLFRQP